ncbi:arylsulfatase B, partial [Elysia marginata]
DHFIFQLTWMKMKKVKKLLGFFSFYLTLLSSGSSEKNPHIIFMVADDLGWNDIGFNNPDIKSPNIDLLARSGVILNHAYVQPVCSPSRSSFMTGWYPFRLGMQHLVLCDRQNACLPLERTLLPQVLKQNGYKTHAIGKWHLGFCKWECTPNYRGFDSFQGYYASREDYYNKSHNDGFDFHKNREVYWEANGTYSSYFYSSAVEKVISEHNVSDPLFLYFPIQSVHEPLQVPEHYYNMYPNVTPKGRRIFSDRTTLERSFTCRMQCTNYKAETEAIKKVLNIVTDKISKTSKVVILSVTRSVLQTLENTKHTELDTLRQKLLELEAGVGELTLQWIPGHSNIEDNEKVDNLAKLGSGLEQETTITYQEAKTMIKMASGERWKKSYEDFNKKNGGWVPYHGNNYPLRGGKISIWEGGTRVPAFIYGKGVKKAKNRYDGLMHAVDWFPTIVEAAGLKYKDHFIISFNLETKNSVTTKQITISRDIPSVNRNTFKEFLNQTILQKDPQSIEAFNATLVEVLDEFAPLRQIGCLIVFIPRGIPLEFKPPSVRRGKLTANGKELD